MDEYLEHFVGVVVVKFGRSPHLIINIHDLSHIALELCLFELGLCHYVLHYLVQALVYLSLMLYALVVPLFLTLFIVRVFDHRLNLMDY